MVIGLLNELYDKKESTAQKFGKEENEYVMLED